MKSIIKGIGKLIGKKDRQRQERLVNLGLVIAVLLGGLVPIVGAWKALVAVAGLAIFAGAFWRPKFGLLLLAVVLPLEPFLLKFVPEDVYLYGRYFSELMVYVLFAAALLRLLVNRRKRPLSQIDLPFAFFLVTALASIALNAVPLGIGMLGLRQIIRFILVFFAIVWLEPDSAFLKRLTAIMFTLVVFESGLGLIQSLTGGRLDEFLIPSERRFFESIQLTTGTPQFWSPGTRIFATMGRYDQLGTFLSFFSLLAVGLLYMVRDKIWRRNAIVVLAFALPALLMTMSRASWFGFLLGLFAIGAWLMKDRRVRLGFLAAIVAAVGYLAYTGLVVRYLTEYPSQTATERFFEAFSYERWRGEYYGLGRLYWMVQTPRVVVPASPVFGHGPGMYGGGAVAALGNSRTYEKLNLPYGVYGSEGYIDNNWFSIWGETGTLGLFFYAWMVIALAAMSLRLWARTQDPWLKGIALGFFGAVLAVSFQAILATYLEVRTLAFYLWAFGGLLAVAAKSEGISLRLRSE